MTRPGASESKKTLQGPFMGVIHESVLRSKHTDLPDEMRKMGMVGTNGFANERGSMPTLLNDTNFLEKADSMG